ncbi:hypothetical protein HDV00_002073, partial [Rhizophlyctis rosea]
MRTKGMKMLTNVFKDVDVIVTPSTGIVAPIIPSGVDKYGLSDYTTSGTLFVKFDIQRKVVNPLDFGAYAIGIGQVHTRIIP